MNYKLRTSKGFTLIELVVAVALMAMVISFASVIFKVGIGAHRIAGANAEIMRKLRAITDQLNADFRELQKDGYLILHSEVKNNRREYQGSDPCDFRADRLYYFCTGDFQSWFDPTVRSNIARVYFGHDSDSLSDDDIPVSNWNLARDVVLLTPGQPGNDDCSPVSYVECKADLTGVLEDPNDVLGDGVEIRIGNDPNDVRRLMCQNVGQIVIEWTDGTIGTANELVWWGLVNQIRSVNPTVADAINESIVPPYRVEWNPGNHTYWPEALKFTFTLYDSKGILEKGQTFTHIVYLD